MNKLKEFENKMMSTYLTEKTLGEFLKIAYPNENWIYNERFHIPNTEEKHRFKPDYCCHNLKLCVEFDGADHYMKTSVIQADNKKDGILKELGYTIIRIPYFIQLTTNSIKYFFDLDIELNYNFKHGFISHGVILPSCFCEQGIWKFKDFVTNLMIEKEKTQEAEEIYNQIKESLCTKIGSHKLPEKEAILNTIPTQLLSTFKFKKFNHDSIHNMNKVHSNLENNWNCVILESSQVLQDLAGTYDFEYTYNSEGNISGYSFNFYYKQKITKYTLLIEKSDEKNYVNIKVFINDILNYSQTFLSSSITIFNITDILGY